MPSISEKVQCYFILAARGGARRLVAVGSRRPEGQGVHFPQHGWSCGTGSLNRGEKNLVSVEEVLVDKKIFEEIYNVDLHFRLAGCQRH